MKFKQSVPNAIMKISALTILLIPAGCAHQQIKTASPVVPVGNAERLMQRTDAQSAVKAAPEWVRDSLHTVNALEAQNKELQAK